MNIRKIDQTDLQYIYQSLCDLENDTLSFNTIQEILTENLSNPNNLYLIAEINHERVGFITFHTQKLLHHCGLVGEIQEFYVSKNCRNQGVGRQLVHEIKNYAELKGLQSVEVTTNKKRTENVAIYEFLGFNLTHNKFTIRKG